MKKRFFAFVFTLVMLFFAFSVCSSAFYVLYVDDDAHSFLRNEYYKIYADDYFEMQYNEYNSDYDKWIAGDAWDVQMDSTGKARASYVDGIRGDDGISYCTVIFAYKSDFSAEKNLQLASSLSDGMEVLYVGNSTPCAVVAVRGSTDDIEKILENENVALVAPAFLQFGTIMVTDAIFEETFTPTAADARKILRYSARLDGLSEDRSENKKFLFMSDTDFDGVITAADARTALRISAGLEKSYTFTLSHSGGAFWNY